MSALSFARQAFSREKPLSSITNWVEILTGSDIEKESYDGIPDLVDSINLQATSGPLEASRALRKKLKHGSPHQQYRALVLLKALVENCGPQFSTASFADGQLIDVLKNMASDSQADKTVKKKLLLVLSSWRDQFKSDPSMTIAAGLYRQCRGDPSKRLSQREFAHLIGLPDEVDKKKVEKEEAKKRAKREKEEKARKDEEDRRQRERNGHQPRRAPFDFEKNKPKVLASIVDASQASSNLANAITLVNLETDSLQTNERVQACLDKAKQARKPVIRYIQLVENEELIGTLIETNERIIAALELYDQMSSKPDGDAAAVTSALATARITVPSNEVNRLQEKQRVAVERAKNNGGPWGAEEDLNLHPDLQDLNFGPLGDSSSNLPAPLRPSALSDDTGGKDKRASYDTRGSLSDFSDYESSDGETHRDIAGSPKRRSARNYVDVSDDPDDYVSPSGSRAKAPLIGGAPDDPFADPFADEVAIGPSRKW